MCVLTMVSNDDIDEEVFLQADDYPTPSHPGLNANVPSTTPTRPQVDLASARSDRGKGEPCSDE